MSKSKRRKQATGVPLRVKLLVAVLVVAVIFGIASVKLLKTTPGKLMLLDAGFTANYPLVQQELDTDLRQALRALGLHTNLREDIRIATIDGETFNVRHWEARCEGSCSSAKVGLAFAKAAKKRGAVARSRIESWERQATSGETIVITVGSRKYATHRITVHRSDQALQVPLPQPTTPKLALVIDDFGYSRGDLVEAFFELDLPLTISVLPSLPRTRYAIERAMASGKQAMLHLPMEAEDFHAQKGVILTTMSDRQIRELVDRYLNEAVGVVGVNNHQGSLATRDARVMQAVVTVMKERGLFFLDSLTSSESIAYNTCRSLNVPTAKNDLFLDDDTDDPLVVEERLLRLLALAKQRGWAVGIGHPKSWTYEAISRNEEILKESGVDLVYVSEMVD